MITEEDTPYLMNSGDVQQKSSAFLTSVYDLVCYVCNNFSSEMRDLNSLKELRENAQEQLFFVTCII